MKKAISFADLQCRYETGRSYLISGSGKERKYGYRKGIMCGLGDLETTEWIQIAKEQIQLANEGELFDNLQAFLKERTYRRISFSEQELEALKSHVSRIFDCPTWVYFIPFNRRYRPEILKQHPLVWILPECCKRPGQITQAVIDTKSNHEYYCPHCGRWTTYIRMSAPQEGVDHAV